MKGFQRRSRGPLAVGLLMSVVGLVGCNARPVSTHLEVFPALGCAGSDVRLSWVADGDAQYVFVHADGRRQDVDAVDSVTVRADVVDQVRLVANRWWRPVAEFTFPFTQVEGEAVVELRANTRCGPIADLDGLEGVVSQLDWKGDPRLHVVTVRIEEGRDLLRVEHAQLRADLPEGQILTRSFEGTPAQGSWSITSPLASAEACEPQLPASVAPPSGLGVELTVTCNG